MKLNRKEVIAYRIKAIIADVSNMDITEIGENDNLVKDLYLDSLDKMELFISLEKNFDCTIPDEVVDGITTVGDLVSVLIKDTKVLQSVIVHRVISIVAKILKCEEDEILIQSRLSEDLHLESHDYMRMFSRMEKQFECSIPMQERETFQTIGDIADYLTNHSEVQEFEVF